MHMPIWEQVLSAVTCQWKCICSHVCKLWTSSNISIVQNMDTCQHISMWSYICISQVWTHVEAYVCMFTHTCIQEHNQELVHTCTYMYAHTCAVPKHCHMSVHMDICTSVQFISMVTFSCTCIYLHSWTFWAWSHGGIYACVDPNMTTCGCLCTCSHSCKLQG